ncbi:hypothetical protein KIF24_27270 [Micromonospora sp. Llam7]|uniref:hypothetical protein n=1 Tax=Micromonospora tarapacensis TaxID=2835305 RepID=UPI001C83B872|nr:hypothetical protein [Micromonospora tarapacensis]MBX7269352.1 hypothetical protein [Micromonospora tarapacensis]
MTSNDEYASALFLAAPTLDEPEDSGASVDGSEEAMRRLRHPFAVGPTAPARGGRR